MSANSIKEQIQKNKQYLNNLNEDSSPAEGVEQQQKKNMGTQGIQAKFCPSCGQETASDGYFCTKCGGSLGKEKATRSVQSVSTVKKEDVKTVVKEAVLTPAEIQKMANNFGGVKTERKRKEYKVLTQKDKWFTGKFDPERLEKAMNSYAEQGWVVKAAFSASIPGVMGNREEAIIILERDV